MIQKPFSNRLVLMVKEPRAGAVKTRLAAGVGATQATAFYRNISSALISQLASCPFWQTYLAIAPQTAVDSPTWPTSTFRFAQTNGDLGERMQRIFDGLPPGPVVIVGTDCPDLTAAQIRQAFTALGRSDAVLGPAKDGGYWLIGLKRRPHTARVFKNVRWSSAYTLQDTLANLSNRSVTELDVLADVDHASDLPPVRNRAGRRVGHQGELNTL